MYQAQQQSTGKTRNFTHFEAAWIFTKTMNLQSPAWLTWSIVKVA